MASLHICQTGLCVLETCNRGKGRQHCSWDANAFITDGSNEQLQTGHRFLSVCNQAQFRYQLTARTHLQQAKKQHVLSDTADLVHGQVHRHLCVRTSREVWCELGWEVCRELGCEAGCELGCEVRTRCFSLCRATNEVWRPITFSTPVGSAHTETNNTISQQYKSTRSKQKRLYRNIEKQACVESPRQHTRWRPTMTASASSRLLLPYMGSQPLTPHPPVTT